MAKQEGAFTMVPNWIIDDTSLDVYERSLLIHVARQTIGYGKKSDGISYSQFAKATGISERQIKRVIKRLYENGYLIVTKQSLPNGGKSFNRYSLPKKQPKADKVVTDSPNGSASQSQGVVTGRHIQKKIEQKERGREFFFSEDEKRAFITHLTSSDTIRNKAAYERKIRAKLNKQDQATMEMFIEWREERERSKALQAFRAKHIGASIKMQTSKAEICGSIQNIQVQDDQYIVTVDQVGKGIKQVAAQTLERIEECIEAEKKVLRES